MRFAKLLHQRLGVKNRSSNRRPFVIEQYDVMRGAEFATASIRATNPYSDATWWWIFTTDLERASVVVETDGLDLGRTVTSLQHVPGNILDLATTLLDEVRRSRLYADSRMARARGRTGA